MEWFIAVVVIAALGVAAQAAAGGMGAMSTDPVRDTYRQDLPHDQPLSADDVAGLRFGVTLRGYAMGQVDDVLARLRDEIAERDARIAELTAGAPGTEGVEHLDPEPAESDPIHTVTEEFDPTDRGTEVFDPDHPDTAQQPAVSAAPAGADGSVR